MVKTKTALKTEVNNQIIRNGVQSITGVIMNGILIDIIDSMFFTYLETYSVADTVHSPATITIPLLVGENIEKIFIKSSVDNDIVITYLINGIESFHSNVSVKANEPSCQLLNIIPPVDNSTITISNILAGMAIKVIKEQIF
jgi:hypothetical protein